jgi:hypothetical protein
MGFIRIGSYGIKQLETFSGLARIAGVNRHAAINTPVGEVDITWLESAAAHYHISPDPYDYNFSINRIVVADIPNRNSDAFSRRELHRFHQTAGKPTWQTFVGKPLYYEHNQVPVDARGIILKSFITTEGPYHCVTNLVGADRKKDSNLAKAIKDGTRPYFSMGCFADSVMCPIDGKVYTEPSQFCPHLKNMLGKTLNGCLVYELLMNNTFIEESSVGDPAALIAGKGNMDLVDGKAILDQHNIW